MLLVRLRLPVGSDPSPPFCQYAPLPTLGILPQGTLTSMLAAVGQHGFTHPNYGHYLMLPPEFDVLLALERKPVVQVVLEIMRATMGWVDDSGEEDEQGRPKRREWARLGHRHFTILCGSPSQASLGLKVALEKGYILRRVTPQGYEYQIHWKQPLD